MQEKKKRGAMFLKKMPGFLMSLPELLSVPFLLLELLEREGI